MISGLSVEPLAKECGNFVSMFVHYFRSIFWFNGNGPVRFEVGWSCCVLISIPVVLNTVEFVPDVLQLSVGGLFVDLEVESVLACWRIVIRLVVIVEIGFLARITVWFEICCSFDVEFEAVFSYLAEMESDWVLFDDAIVSEVTNDVI